MKKGDIARETVKNQIIKAFGDNYIGQRDKKIYVNAKDGPSGEIIQVAISMTIAKIQIGNFVEDGGGAFPSTTEQKPNSTELSDEDKSEVARLMKKLNIL